MQPTGMEQRVGEAPVPLIAVLHQVGIELELREDVLPLEGNERNNGRDGDDDQRHSNVDSLFINCFSRQFLMAVSAACLPSSMISCAR